MRAERHRLFREATQLKTEAATVQRSRIEPLYSEIQGYATGILFTGRGSGGKTETSVADIPSFTVSVTAVARGGAARPRLFREATQLKTVGTAVVCKAGIEPRDFEEEILSVNAPCGGRPTITVITDAVHVAQSILFT